MMQEHFKKLMNILEAAVIGQRLSHEEIRFLLSLSDEESLAALFKAARQKRYRYFGNKVFLYGFIYFSTDCTNDCLFCKYRKSNKELPRYHKSLSEIEETAREMIISGVHLIDLTMGESNEFHRHGDIGFKKLSTLVRSVKTAGGMPLMISPGVVPTKALQDLKSAGADWFACYQETYNRSLFSRLRVGQSFDKRLSAKRTARKLGMRIEEGILLGVGESLVDVVDAIVAMRTLNADQVRVMTFVPNPGTPMADHPVPNELQELVTIAVLRLTMPDKLIPASLDVGGLAGLKKRLVAGANVVSSLVIPGKGLAGVAHQKMDIEQARRTPEAVSPILADCGLRAATMDEYLEWMESQRHRHSLPTSDQHPAYETEHKVA